MGTKLRKEYEFIGERITNEGEYTNEKKIAGI